MPAKTPRKRVPPPEIHVGDRVELIYMPEEPAFGTLYKAGDQGTVIGINPTPFGERQISVDWDNGRSLMLLEGVDEYKIIKEDT